MAGYHTELLVRLGFFLVVCQYVVWSYYHGTLSLDNNGAERDREERLDQQHPGLPMPEVTPMMTLRRALRRRDASPIDVSIQLISLGSWAGRTPIACK